MICPLSLAQGKEVQCQEINCGIWDKKQGQCGLLTYFYSYYQLQIATLKLHNQIERMEATEDEP